MLAPVTPPPDPARLLAALAHEYVERAIRAGASPAEFEAAVRAVGAQGLAKR